ncbi:hypothetical protein ABZ470_26545 [Streptosporangium sp. NPDC020072]|uniref:hypothetical protein n=1 Tax=Streptosporangium sp. NPDC020072 TaxID=3154788 RepID=UPI0034154C81
MPNTTTPLTHDELVRLIAARAAQHWSWDAKSELIHLLADILGDYDAAYDLVEETGRKLLVAAEEGHP